MMKKVYIYCDGGFGNRLGALVGGIAVAKRLNYEYEIIWPITNWCACNFEDLYTTNIKTHVTEIGDFIKNNEIDHLVTHTGYRFESKKNYRMSNPMYSTKTNFDLDNIIVYNATSLPQDLSESNIIDILLSLQIEKTIVDNVNHFMMVNKIDKSTLGLHIRKTDLPQADDNYFITTIKNNPNNNFFICSDDENMEKMLSSIGNVVYRTKNDYVKKINDNIGWNDGNNVYRSKQSVIDAFTDMLLLSRTTILNKTRFSTFLNFAILYNKIK